MLAIAGAGDLAGALAHRAAARGRFREVRLIDDTGTVAAGKALDIRQAGPVDGYDTRLAGHTGLDAFRGASVITIADRPGGGEWEGDAALQLIASLLPVAGKAPLLFAGARQRWLMEAAHRELKVPASRMVGSAPVAFDAALTSLAALAADRSALEIALHAYGRPPDHPVIAWDSAVCGAAPLERVLAPHERLAISERAKGLWPPGPVALASAAARVADALAFGTRREFTCFVFADRQLLPHGTAAAMPVALGAGGVLNVKRPALSPREQVAFDTAVQG